MHGGSIPGDGERAPQPRREELTGSESGQQERRGTLPHAGSEGETEEDTSVTTEPPSTLRAHARSHRRHLASLNPIHPRTHEGTRARMLVLTRTVAPT